MGTVAADSEHTASAADVPAPAAATATSPAAETGQRAASGLRALLPPLWQVNALALVAVALWFRCRQLGNIPGINGDEAWYGVRVLEVLAGQPTAWQTPTGNLLNPFFFGPMLLLHLCCGPSPAVLRSVAVGSGVAALVLNWLLCRRVFDRRTAVVSTVLLAILPINIAYSRFAWDASQSLAATLLVFYCSLAVVRFPRRRRWLLAAAIVAQLAAILVHPANVFAAAAPAAAWAATADRRGLRQAVARVFSSRKKQLAAALIAGTIASAAVWLWLARPAVLAERLSGVGELLDGTGLSRLAILYPRLFSGETIYQYIAGSHSWSCWPDGPIAGTWGIDVPLFWAVLAAAACAVWRSWTQAGRWEDRVLLAAFALQWVAFALVAGPAALSPGWERYAVGLIGPGVLVLARGAAVFGCGGTPRRQVVLAAVGLCGWLALADFQAHYFAFIERTGGRAHRTFRTAAVEPKWAAVQLVLRHRQPGPTWIVASEHWTYWPLRYFAWQQPDVWVVGPEEAADSTECAKAAAQGRLWRVEFVDAASFPAQNTGASAGAEPWSIEDFGGRPVLRVQGSGGRGQGPGFRVQNPGSTPSPEP